MKNAGEHRLLWYFALLSGLMIGAAPMFLKATDLSPVIVGAGLTLMVIALLGLRRPKRVRLPRKRTFS